MSHQTRQSGDGDSPLTVGDYRRDEEESTARAERKELVESTVETAYSFLERGEIGELVHSLVTLAEVLDLDSVITGGTSLEGFPVGHEFHGYEVQRFWQAVSDSRAVDMSATQLLKLVTEESPRETRPRQVAHRILDSLVTLAVVRGVLPDALQQSQPVYGHTMQLGERYVRADSSATGELNIRDQDEELKSLLCAGGKGSGKSTALETLVHDSYQNGHKIVDLVDFFKAENVLYDCDQQDNGEGLIEAREEIGLTTGFQDVAAGFAWLDGDPEWEREDLITSPEMEVLVPLCPGLAEMRIPEIKGVGQPRVRPFSIPASELTYRQLVMLLHHTTEARENALRSAHQALRDTDKDWTLADVATEVRRSSTATDRLADDIETTLKTAQEKSFIRDKDCPYALDWEEVMRDERTITCFSVHPVKETSDHLVILSYLIDSLFQARDELLTSMRLSEYPPLTAVMREMSEVAPRSTSEQSAESTVESYMIDSLSDLFKLTRHANMEILADTQQFHRQLHPDVSGLFDQILAFRGHVPDVRKIFKTRIHHTGPSERVAQFEDAGKCALVGEGGYRMPIQMAPPPSHHLEAKSEGNGLGFRTKIRSSERLVESPYEAGVPPRLRFTNAADHEVDVFLSEYVRVVNDRDEWELMSDIHQAYLEWAEEHDHPKYEQGRVTARVTRTFDEIGDATQYRPVIDGQQVPAHRRLILEWE